MYIDFVPNRNSRPAILLREAWREGKKIKKRTIANLSDWPREKIEALRRVLKGEKLIPAKGAFKIERSLPHGHVEAVLGTIKKLKLDTIISSTPSRERDLVIAMIVERIIHPSSKLATTRIWHTSSLAESLKVTDADEDELYKAMNWLVTRQKRVQKKLAARHLDEGSFVLYDVTSSYYEGRHCSLAQFGHNRDKKKGKRIIVYGLLTDDRGCPIGVEVYPGNTGDPTTVPDQVEKLRGDFGLQRVVLVGDRGMLTQTQINSLKKYPGLGWISALRSNAIRGLVEGGHLQLSLFDRRDIAEIRSPEFEGERLVVCYNPLLAEERSRKREELLAFTERELEKVARAVARRKKKLFSKEEIGTKIGKVINRYKMAKHFDVTVNANSLSYSRNKRNIEREQKLDGIYVIRTSEKDLSAEDTVRGYKKLSQVEQVFRCMKGVELRVRPIFHRIEERVKAHIFLCMLAYYVEWHMRKALGSLLFDDEQVEVDRMHRDPVKPAHPSESAKMKKQTRLTKDGLQVQSFVTLLAQLSTKCRNLCRVKSAPDAPPFLMDTEMNPLQIKAFELLGLFPVKEKP